jgi:hypothetical protein
LHLGKGGRGDDKGKNTGASDGETFHDRLVR